MGLRVTFPVTDDLIKVGIRRMDIEYLKTGCPVGLIVWLLGALVIRSFWQSEDMLFGVWIGLLLFPVGFFAYLHFHRIRRLTENQNKLGIREATLVLLPEGMRVEHELAQALLPWRIYNRLVRHPDVWFLHYSRHDFLMLPVDALTEEAKNFIVQSIRAVGGTVI